jgi:hypothetical protein
MATSTLAPAAFDADDADVHTADIEYLEILDARQVVIPVSQVRRYVLEISDVNHLLQVLCTPVKVVVPERIDVEPHHIH